MADLSFNIKANTQELEKALKAMDDLEKKVNELNGKLNSASSGKEFSALSKQISDLEGRFESLSKKAAEMQKNIIDNTNKAAETTKESANIETQANESMIASIEQILGTKNQNLLLLAKEQSALSQVQTEKRLLDVLEKNGVITVQNATNRRANLISQEMEHKVAISELRSELMSEVKEMMAADSSMKQISQTLGRMREAYRQMSAEERDSAFGQQLQKDIQTTNKKMIDLDASIGNHQRNVGNYANAWNGLNMSVQQVVRELPSLKMGANMFFLAISNNLPIMADEIKRANIEYKSLTSQGKTATPVWKQLLSSMFGWQSAMMVGITLLTMFGKNIVDWIAQLFSASKSQKALNESMTDFYSILGKDESNLKILFNTLEKTTVGTEGRKKAIEAINTAYGKYLPNLLSEKSTIMELNTAYQLINKSLLENAALKAQSKAIDKEVNTAIDDQSKLLMDMRKSLSKVNGTDSANSTVNEIISMTERLTAAGKSFSEIRNQVSAFVANGSNGVKKYGLSLFTDIENYVKSVKDAKKTISDIQKQYSPFMDNDKANKAIVKNKQYWEEVKQQAVSVIDSIDSKTKSLLDAGKTQGIDETIVKNYENAKKNITEADKALKSYNTQQTKIKDRAKDEKAVYDMILQNELKFNSEKIALLQDGKDKSVLIAKQESAERIAAIDKEKSEYILKMKELKKVPDETVLKTFSDRQKIENEKLNQDLLKIDMDYQKKYKDNLNELINEHGDYISKKEEIESDYYNYLEKLDKERSLAIEQGDTNTLSTITRLQAQAQKDYISDLGKNSLETLKADPSYIRAFEDFNNTSTDTLENLIQKFNEAKLAAGESLNPEDLKEYMDIIEKMTDEVAARNPFEALINAEKEQSAAVKNLVKAQKDLNSIKSGIPVFKSLENENGKLKVTYLSEAEAIEEVNKANNDLYKSHNNVVKAEKAINEEVSTLIDNLKKVGDAIGGESGNIINLIADIGQFVININQQMDSVSKTASKSIQAIEKASVILSIISAAIQVVQKIGELGAKFDANYQYQKYAEKIKSINEMTEAVNEYAVAVAKAAIEDNNWFGNDKLKKLEDYQIMAQKAFEAYWSKMLESQATYRNETGSGWLTNAIKILTPATWVAKLFGSNTIAGKFAGSISSAVSGGYGNYKEGQTAAMDNLRIETRKKSKGFLGTGIGGKSQKTQDLVSWVKENLGLDLFDEEGWLNDDAYTILMDKYADKLSGETKATLDALNKNKKEYDEFKKQLQEYVSELYEPLVENYVNSIWDWLDSGKDALKSFKDYAKDTFRNIVSDMIRTIAMKQIFSGFQDDISKIYEKYALDGDEKAMAEAIAKRVGELNVTIAEKTPGIEALMASVNQSMKDIAGIDLANTSTSSGNSLSGATAKASQESIDLFSGQMGAARVTLDKIADGMTPIREQMNQIYDIQKTGWEDVRTIRTLSERIESNTNEIRLLSIKIQDNTKNTANALEGTLNVKVKL